MTKTACLILAAWLLVPLGARNAADTAKPPAIEPQTLDQWSAPYRDWHYQPSHVIGSQPNIPGHEKFHNTDVPCVYQLPGQPDKWYMSFIAFNGQSYNSFVAESTDYEGVACSDDGLTWRRAKNAPILAVQDPDCGAWEKDCIHQPRLVEDGGRFFNFYAHVMAAFSRDLIH